LPTHVRAWVAVREITNVRTYAGGCMGTYQRMYMNARAPLVARFVKIGGRNIVCVSTEKKLMLARRHAVTWGCGVVVSHLLRMQRVPGSNPGVSTLFSACYGVNPEFLKRPM
jgi:hypothetical protein